jgi:hypothetical protein
LAEFRERWEEAKNSGRIGYIQILIDDIEAEPEFDGKAKLINIWNCLMLRLA